MPMNKAMMEEMQKQYGKKHGMDVYYAVEAKQKSKKKAKGKKKKLSTKAGY